MRAPLLWLASGLLSCAPAPISTVGRFGEVTSAVVVVNPVINQGSTTTVVSGGQRGNIEVRAADLALTVTDVTGLALVEGFGTGSVPLRIGGGSIDLQVQQARELYDVVVSVNGNTVTRVVPDVRYPLGGEVVVVEPGGDLASAVSKDGAIVVLRPGTYEGSLELTARNVLLFGAWQPDAGPQSIIRGAVTVRGGGNRMRGVAIEGVLASNANDFSAAFCTLGAASISGNGVSLIRNTFTGGQAAVPSSNAVLVDNVGIP